MPPELPDGVTAADLELESLETREGPPGPEDKPAEKPADRPGERRTEEEPAADTVDEIMAGLLKELGTEAPAARDDEAPIPAGKTEADPLEALIADEDLVGAVRLLAQRLSLSEKARLELQSQIDDRFGADEEARIEKEKQAAMGRYKLTQQHVDLAHEVWSRATEKDPRLAALSFDEVLRRVYTSDALAARRNGRTAPSEGGVAKAAARLITNAASPGGAVRAPKIDGTMDNEVLFRNMKRQALGIAED